MSRANTAWLLWASSWLLLPLPYFIIATGRVPVVRFAILSVITVTYAGIIDGSGVAWAMASILLGHVVVYSVLLGIGSVVVARMIPKDLRRTLVWTLIAVGFATAIVFQIYRTPFDATSMRSNWIGLFQ